MEFLSTILSTVVAILSAWFAYNQHSKNKLTDLKVEQMKKESEKKDKSRNRDAAIIFSELWPLLHELKADRVFILQPHPEDNHKYVSVAFEISRKGVSTIRDIFQNIPMSEMALFVKQVATCCWIVINDIEKEVDDPKTRSLMRIGGSRQIAIKQLVNYRGDWIGSLVVESTNETYFDPLRAKEMMKSVANTIQFILPPIQ